MGIELKKIIFALFLLSFSSNLSFAQNSSTKQNFWSFRNNPHPLFYEYSEQEREKINDIISKNGSCKNILEAEYEIYKSRYPDIAKYNDEATNKKYWERYLVKEIVNGEMIVMGACLYMEKIYRLMNLSADDDFYYCGNYSRSPNDISELEIASLINELVEYVKIGYKPAMPFFLIIADNRELIRLNIDVEYYLRKFLEIYDDRKMKEEEKNYFTASLSKEKLAMLDEAVRNKDFAAVLAKTAKCK